MTLFNKIPAIRWIELVVDGLLLNSERGYLRFEEREPGSIEHVLNALAFSIENRKTPLSAKHIKILHDLILRNVKGLNEDVSRTTGRVRSEGEGVSFTVYKSHITLEGLREFLSSHRTDLNTAILEDADGINYLKKEAYQYTAEQIYENVPFLKYHAPIYSTEEELEAALELLAQGYHQEIKSALSPLDKLAIIVKYTQRFERLHPFFDGNGRTFVNVLLNTLLIDNHFYPAIFFDPNVFDLYSVPELVNIVIEGMWFFEYIALNPAKPLFYDHISLPSSEQVRLSVMSENLVKALTCTTDEEQFFRPYELLSDHHHLNLLHVATGNFQALQSLTRNEISHLLDEHNIGKSDSSIFLKNMHPVHLAARFGHVDILEWMFTFKKQLLHLPDAKRETALHFAARFSNLTTITILLNNDEQQKPSTKKEELSICAATSGTIDVFNAMAREKLERKNISATLFLNWFINALHGTNCPVINQLCDWINETPDHIDKMGAVLAKNVKIKQQINMAFCRLVKHPYPHELRRVLTLGNSLFPPHLDAKIFEKTLIWTKKEQFFLLVQYGVKLTYETLVCMLEYVEELEWFLQTIDLPAVTREILNNTSILVLSVHKYGKNDAVLTALFKKGLNPYLLFNDGSSILHRISNLNWGMHFLHYLKEQGRLNAEEVNRQNIHGVTPLISAILQNNEDLIHFFIANGAHKLPPYLIGQVAQHGTFQILSLVLDYLELPFDEAINRIEGEHPLIIVLSRKKFAMADLLIQYGCHLDVVWTKTNQTLREMINSNLDEEIKSWINNKQTAFSVANSHRFCMFSNDSEGSSEQTLAVSNYSTS